MGSRILIFLGNMVILLWRVKISIVSFYILTIIGETTLPQNTEIWLSHQYSDISQTEADLDSKFCGFFRLQQWIMSKVSVMITYQQQSPLKLNWYICVLNNILLVASWTSNLCVCDVMFLHRQSLGTSCRQRKRHWRRTVASGSNRQGCSETL